MRAGVSRSSWCRGASTVKLAFADTATCCTPLRLWSVFQWGQIEQCRRRLGETRQAGIRSVRGNTDGQFLYCQTEWREDPVDPNSEEKNAAPLRILDFRPHLTVLNTLPFAARFLDVSTATEFTLHPGQSCALPCLSAKELVGDTRLMITKVDRMTGKVVAGFLKIFDDIDSDVGGEITATEIVQVHSGPGNTVTCPVVLLHPALGLVCVSMKKRRGVSSFTTVSVMAVLERR